MSRQLKFLQVILAICVTVLAFYLLKDIDYYGAAGIGILWGIAAFLGVQALNEWNLKRSPNTLIREEKTEPPEEPSYPVKDWADIKSSLYLLKIKLEDMEDAAERKKLAHKCVKILRTYDDFISKYGEHIPEKEKLGVLEDLQYCSWAFQEYR